MNIYNYTYYRIYRSISRINNLFPAFSTSVYLSILIFINLTSILLLLKIPLDKIGLNALYLGLTGVYVLNYIYIIKKNRYKEILEKFDKEENNIFLNLIIYIYPFLSFFIFFKTLEIDNTTTFITVGILVLIDIIARFLGNSDDKSKP